MHTTTFHFLDQLFVEQPVT